MIILSGQMSLKDNLCQCMNFATVYVLNACLCVNQCGHLPLYSVRVIVIINLTHFQLIGCSTKQLTNQKPSDTNKECCAFLIFFFFFTRILLKYTKKSSLKMMIKRLGKKKSFIHKGHGKPSQQSKVQSFP